MFYLNSTLNFGMPPVLVFQLEVYYKVDRLLTGLTVQQKGTTASNKTSLPNFRLTMHIISTITYKDRLFCMPTMDCMPIMICIYLANN